LKVPETTFVAFAKSRSTLPVFEVTIVVTLPAASCFFMVEKRFPMPGRIGTDFHFTFS
jgi:hypothetical protein